MIDSIKHNVGTTQPQKQSRKAQENVPLNSRFTVTVALPFRANRIASVVDKECVGEDGRLAVFE